MPSLARIASYLVLIAMFLAAGAPLLSDTTPGSERSIAVAVVGVMLAIGQLLQVLQMRALRRSQQLHEDVNHS
jgi:hypothetical protein